MMAQDYNREILNAVNQFRTYLNRIISWNEVLKLYPETQSKYKIVIEFIEPVASTLINKPYIVKNLFIFTTAHLLHQTNKLCDRNWKENDLAKDQNINFKKLQQVAEEWEQYVPFAESISLLNNEEFNKATGEYRNKEHHRIPPAIEVGITSIVSRISHKNGSVGYGVGGKDPLKLENITPALIKQHTIAIESYKKFWILLQSALEKWEELLAKENSTMV